MANSSKCNVHHSCISRPASPSRPSLAWCRSHAFLMLLATSVSTNTVFTLVLWESNTQLRLIGMFNLHVLTIHSCNNIHPSLI